MSPVRTTLLVSVVQGLYDKRHSPVPGALVKAQLISEAIAFSRIIKRLHANPPTENG